MDREEPKICIFLLMANVIAKNFGPKRQSLCLRKQCEHFRLKENSPGYCGISGESIGIDNIQIKSNE